MNTMSESAWRDIVAQSPEGIVVCDATVPDCPVVYANAAFLQLSGYPLSALLGRNLRLLQGSDQDQEGRQRIREALAKGDAKAAQAQFRLTVSMLDKSVQKGVLHSNTVSRYKSRLNTRLKALATAKAK